MINNVCFPVSNRPGAVIGTAHPFLKECQNILKQVNDKGTEVDVM